MTNKPFVIGALAQVVEHRTENPCVPGSNPGGTTKKDLLKFSKSFFYIGETIRVFGFFRLLGAFGIFLNLRLLPQ